MTARDLVGGRIAQVFDVEDEIILVVEKDGRVLQAEVWRPEKNGPISLFVSLIPGATSGNQVRLADRRRVR